MALRNIKTVAHLSNPKAARKYKKAIKSNILEPGDVTSDLEWTEIIIPHRIWLSELDKSGRLKSRYHTIMHFALPLTESAYLLGYQVGFKAAQQQHEKLFGGESPPSVDTE
jgi:hypothetical protein